MAAKVNKDLILLCHPYLFALKEGSDIRQDFLDYSLLLMQRNCSEVIKSPMTSQRKQATYLVTPYGEKLTISSAQQPKT